MAMQTLTEAQWHDWNVNGFLQIPGALTAEEVTFFSEQVDRMRGLPGWEPNPPEVPLGHYTWVERSFNPDTEAFMDRRDLLTYDPAFIDLIDRPGIFDLVVDIMGPYVLHSMSQAIVRASGDGFEGYTHTDGGEALRRIRVTETSRPLAMKAMYLLSDVDADDCGNFTVFPGSHMRPFPEEPHRRPSPDTPGAVPLTGKAGDCYLFPHSLWHGPSPNHSGHARKTLLYNYCQMFIRLYDFETTSDVKDRCTPRQRRLLGDLGHAFRPGDYFYVPQDQVEIIEQSRA